MAKPSWQMHGRLHGSDAAKMAIPVYVCARPGCEVHHPAKKDQKGKWRQPDKCIGCGGIVFEYFASTTEANRWAALRLQERGGIIKNLRRQVKYPLYTIAPNGLRVWVADLIADYDYERDGIQVTEDRKPRSGMDPVAALKFRWFAAQHGREVLVTTS
jgi:hypothetical protein